MTTQQTHTGRDTEKRLLGLLALACYSITLTGLLALGHTLVQFALYDAGRFIQALYPTAVS